MNSVQEEALKLRELLLNNEVVKEYLSLKSQIENNVELDNMRKEIAKQPTNKKELIDQYNSHPLINNYSIVKDELSNLLKTIKNIISE